MGMNIGQNCAHNNIVNVTLGGMNGHMNIGWNYAHGSIVNVPY